MLKSSEIQRGLIAFMPLLVGVAAALVIIALILEFEDATLRELWEALYSGAGNTPSSRARMLRNMLPLLLCSSGLLLTFTTGLWNIGIEGQLTMGALGASLGALYVSMPNRELQLGAQLLLAFSAGAGWALLTAILRTRGGINEIFGGVALNFIAALFTAFLISGPWSPGISGTGSRTAAFAPETLLPARAIERAFVSDLGMLLAFGGFILVALTLYLTRFGLQLKAIGRSRPSADALGIPAERNIWLAMFFCGGLAGLGGAILVLHPPTGQLQTNASGGIGFLGLLVVLLASIRPWLVPPIVLLFAFMNTGAQRVETSLRIDSSLMDVLQGLLVLTVLLFDGLRGRFERARERRLIAQEAVRRAQAAEAEVQQSA